MIQINYSAYSEKYSKLRTMITSRKLIYKVITIVYKVSPLVLFVAYPILLAYLFYAKDEHFVKVFAIPFITFMFVTMIRKLINRPRPYETHSIEPLFPKNTQGKSFPSRHVASAVIITFAFFYINSLAGIISLAVTAVITILRPIAGIHYISDVLFAIFISSAFGLMFYFI